MFSVSDEGNGEKMYILDMFPYPSSAGLHVGHPEGYTATDIVARYMRMRGKRVLHPMGWDAFGLPAENYAIKQGVHPRETTWKNIENFRRQIKMLGFSYDWSREINTADPAYYKWTQWLFLALYRRGLAYRKQAPVNWCTSCQTVLAREQVINGKCERCKREVVQKDLEQWFFRITEYADRLLDDLDGLDWPEPIKLMQRNWIGRSEGAEIDFEMRGRPLRFVLLHGYKGSSDRNFFPWLAAELRQRGYEVVVPDLPNTDNPSIDEQVRFVLDTCSFDGQTVVMGHSLGAVVALKVVEQITSPITRLVLVSGFVNPRFADGKERPFVHGFNWQFNSSVIRSNVSEIAVLHDRADGIVSRSQADELAEMLNVSLEEYTAAVPHFCGQKEPRVLTACVDTIRVFTTRPDTLFGATYMVLAPEHPMVPAILPWIKNKTEVEAYQEESRKKTELERTDLAKEKTGVAAEGAVAINPATGEKIPVWIADYVLAGYGTGAIMAVPAHDERDFSFAKKYNLPIRVVVKHQSEFEDVDQQKQKELMKKIFLVSQEQGWFVVLVGGLAKELHDISNPFHSDIDLFATPKSFEGISSYLASVGFKEEEMGEEYGWRDRKSFSHPDGFWVDLFLLQEDGGVYFDEVAHKRFEWGTRDNFKTYNINGVHVVVPSQELLEKIYQNMARTAVFCFTGSGIVVNSGEFNGLKTEEFKIKIVEWLRKNGFGKRSVNYRLRDWLVSRQRYWGAPIPIIYCDACGEVPVPEDQLPVELPDDIDFRPTGESPLARSKRFHTVVCPRCGAEDGVRRESDTMDTFVDSSWYFLRYTDPHNTEAFASSERVSRWCPVDLYVGGAEHAVMHLLYARFVTKALHDAGHLPFSEPFLRLRNQGMILAEDGRKMSKSLGNVINPDEVVAEYGADTMRLYEMFMGPLEDAKPWSTKGIVGVRRFLEKVWMIVTEKERRSSASSPVVVPPDSSPLTRLAHQTIKKVTEDIEGFKFNTAISQLMIFANELSRCDRSNPLFDTYCAILVLLLSPFAPHISEELWEHLGHAPSIIQQPWPQFAPDLVRAETIEFVVQVNGKVRDRFEASADISEEEARKTALARENVQRFVAGKEPRKVVFVKGKLINIVV